MQAVSKWGKYSDRCLHLRCKSKRIQLPLFLNMNGIHEWMGLCNQGKYLLLLSLRTLSMLRSRALVSCLLIEASKSCRANATVVNHPCNANRQSIVVLPSSAVWYAFVLAIVHCQPSVSSVYDKKQISKTFSFMNSRFFHCLHSVL